MPFPAHQLNPGEEVVVDVRPHVWALAGPVLIVVVFIAAAAAGAALHVPDVVGWILIVLLALALVHLLARYVTWRATTLVVTNDRLIRRSGVLSKNGREIPLSQLTDISYRQNIFNRIIGAGDVVLESAGRESEEVFPSLPHPAEIQNEIYGLMSARQGRTVAPTASLSLPEQLEKLADLRQRGVLSEAEFASTKARLLQSGG
jgi:uncharacterized membrane protein YdbT with pleckstrin-like domain